MDIAVIGTGIVGRTLASGLAATGHRVSVGTRDVQATVDRHGRDSDFQDWLSAHPGIRLQRFIDAAAGAELVVNATAGRHSLEALQAAGAANLDGKVLWDVANPLDASRGFPPRLDPVDGDSLGEQIQRAFPHARVVKSLNTMSAPMMMDPGHARPAHTAFVSGNDAEAKETVLGLVRGLGHADVIDLGGIETARGPEMYLGLWVRLFGALGTPEFNLRIIR